MNAFRIRLFVSFFFFHPILLHLRFSFVRFVFVSIQTNRIRLKFSCCVSECSHSDARRNAVNSNIDWKTFQSSRIDESNECKLERKYFISIDSIFGLYSLPSAAAAASLCSITHIHIHLWRILLFNSNKHSYQKKEVLMRVRASSQTHSHSLTQTLSMYLASIHSPMSRNTQVFFLSTQSNNNNHKW